MAGPVAADPHIDPSDDVGADYGPETDAGVELEVAGAGLVQGVHHGSQIDKGGDLPIRGHIEYLPAEKPDPFLQVAEKETVVDEAVSAVAPQSGLPSQDTLFQERDSIPLGLAVHEAEDADVAGIIQRDEPLGFNLVALEVGRPAESLEGGFDGCLGKASIGWGR